MTDDTVTKEASSSASRERTDIPVGGGGLKRGCDIEMCPLCQSWLIRTATTGLKDYDTTATRVVDYYNCPLVRGTQEKRSKHDCMPMSSP